MERTENCKELFALLSEYLDLSLAPEACAELEAHLNGCAPCVEFAESLRATVELCWRYRPAEMPAPIGDRARAQLLEKWQQTTAAMRLG
jgi:hypothetical protein